MTTTLQIGDYIEFQNKARLVYVGDDCLLEHRRYRNILTNEMSDWRPADNAKPQKMHEKQMTEFLARKISA